MKNIVLALALLTLLATGCTELRQNLTQYQVVGRPNERGVSMAVTTNDREGVKQIVVGLGTQWRLQDRTSSSFLPAVIASFTQDWNETRYPTSLLAFENEGKIIVDLSQSSPEVGETQVYQARAQQLLNALREKFGERAVTPRLMDYVRHVQEPVK